MPYKKLKINMTAADIERARQREESANKALAEMKFIPHRSDEDAMYGDKNVVDLLAAKWAEEEF